MYDMILQCKPGSNKMAKHQQGGRAGFNDKPRQGSWWNFVEVFFICKVFFFVCTYLRSTRAVTSKGILLPSWSSVQYTSAIFEILISEKLGWNIEVDTAQPSSSLEAMYNIMGCATPSEGANHGCDQRNIKNRLMFESWHLIFSSAVQDLAEKYPAEMVIDAGSMGFDGVSGQYVPQTFLDAAWNTAGIALEYYKSYDARHSSCMGSLQWTIMI